jgi:hypothetical protein
MWLAVFILCSIACGGGGGDSSASSGIGGQNIDPVQRDVAVYVSTIAGVAPGSTDGVGAAVRFNYPSSVAGDADNIYIADSLSHTIRKIALATGEVTTLAGKAAESGFADGIGTAARFYMPRGISIDGDYLYVADSGNNIIRKIDMNTREVKRIAGSAGNPGFADGNSTAALFRNPTGITTDANIIYVSDTNNHVIRRIDKNTGDVTTLAGTAGLQGSSDGAGSAARFFYPHGITTDRISIFIADTDNHVIRKIAINTGEVTTLAGQAGAYGYSNGTGAVARFYKPHGITITNDGTLYVADTENSNIRKIDIQTREVTTLAGNAGKIGAVDGIGAGANFNTPWGINTDGTYIYVADTNNHIIRKVTGTGEVNTLAGNAAAPGSVDGIGTAALFYNPSGITTDGNCLYIADNFNHTIRKINILTGESATLAGKAGQPGSTNAIGSAARFKYPDSVTISTDGTCLYTADTGNHAIRKIVIQTGEVTTLAGLPGASGSIDGTGANSRFYNPRGIIANGTSLYVADTDNCTIREIIIQTAEVSTLAGFPGALGSTDGTGTAARFNTPRGIIIDGRIIYVSDTGNHTIRKILLDTGEVTTLAGTAGSPCWNDGIGTAAHLFYPHGIIKLGDCLYIADSGNDTIRKINTVTRAVTTLAGMPRKPYWSDGDGLTARFNYPCGLSTDGTNIYMTDCLNNAVRKIEFR